MTPRRCAIGALLVYAASGVYFVAPGEHGLIRFFGKVITNAESGIHYRLPFPLMKLDKLRTREMRRVTVGAEAADLVLGRAAAGQSEFVSADLNIVNAQLTVQFTVADPRSYLFSSSDPDALVRHAATAAVSRVLNARAIDSVMTTGKAEAVAVIRSELERLLAPYNLGVTIRQVSLEKTAPPVEVAEAFRDVTNAREDRDRLTQEADGYALQTVPQARGEAQQLVTGAAAYRATKLNQAKGEAARFAKLVAEYRKAKEVTSQRLYLEAMEEILPGIRKVIVDSNGGRAPVDFGIVGAK